MDYFDLGVSDLCYAGFVSGSLVIGSGATGYRVVMVGFAVTIGVVDWLEVRRRGRSENTRLLAITVLCLATLLGCVTVPETKLALYFIGLGAVFFLQAIRHVLVYNPNPIVLFRHGYPSLVGISIVCSALADGVIQFRRVLIILLAATFLFRKLYVRW